jgi:hypothetical protein
MVADFRAVDIPEWPQWQPSTIHKFRFEQFQLPKGQALNVLIDDDKQDPKVVSVFWFETWRPLPRAISSPGPS